MKLRLSMKTIGLAVLLPVLLCYPVHAYQSDPIKATVGIAPSVGLLWGRHGKFGLVADMSGSAILVNGSLQYRLMQQEHGGRVFGGLGYGMVAQIQIGYGLDGWNGRLKLGLPLNKDGIDSFESSSTLSPVLSVFAEVGPARDAQGGFCLAYYCG